MNSFLRNFVFQDHKDVVSCLTFNWNDTSIASGSVNGDILLHNVISGQASDPLRLVKTQVQLFTCVKYVHKILLCVECLINKKNKII